MYSTFLCALFSRLGRFHEDFPLKEGTVRVPLPFSRNRPENHSHNLGKALGEGLGLFCAPFTLYPFTSLSLLISALSISLLLSLFSLSFSLAYQMDVFVLVTLKLHGKFIYGKLISSKLFETMIKLVESIFLSLSDVI